MAKLSVKSFLSLSRRCYAVGVTENMRQPAVASAAMNISESGGLMRTETTTAESKEVFWMRDPKTGNWIPETHFGEVDVADLRLKLLSKK